MKKVIIIFFVCVFLLISGCDSSLSIAQDDFSKVEYDEVWEARFYLESTKKHMLSDSDQFLFNEILSGEWEEGMAGGREDVGLFNEKGEKISYCSTDGVLSYSESFEKDGQYHVTVMHMQLEDSEKNKLNECLKVYGDIGKFERSSIFTVNGEEVELAPGGGCGLDWEEGINGGEDITCNWDGSGPKEALEDLIAQEELWSSEGYTEGMLNVLSNSDDIELVLSRDSKLRQVLVFNENLEEIASFKTLGEIYNLDKGKYYIGLDVYTQGLYVVEVKERVFMISVDFFTFIVE